MQLTVILYLFSFLRTLFIIAVVYFIIRIVYRYVLPLLIQKGVRNMQERMQDQYRSYQQNGRREGDVTIEKKKDKQQNHSPGEGEYIDFEEVD